MTKTLLIAQIIISCLMAFCMTGIFGFLALGPTAQFLAAWPKSFAMAWPVAFVLSMVIGKFAFAIAGRLTLPRAP